MTTKVEMRPAYEWTCEDCGRNQFVSSMVAEFTDEDKIAQAKHLGLIEEYEDEVPEEFDCDWQTYSLPQSSC